MLLPSAKLLVFDKGRDGVGDRNGGIFSRDMFRWCSGASAVKYPGTWLYIERSSTKYTGTLRATMPI